MAPTLEASSSSCRSEPNQPDHTIPESKEVEEPEAITSSPQLETFHPGPSFPQPQSEFVGLRVVDEPEEMRDANDLRAGLLQRHRPWPPQLRKFVRSRVERTRRQNFGFSCDSSRRGGY